MSHTFNRHGGSSHGRDLRCRTTTDRCRAHVRSLDEAVPAVAIVGDLDLASYEDVALQLRARSGSLGPGEVLLLDLSGLVFLDACGTRALAGTAGELRRRGAGFVLRGARPLARTVLEVCGVDQLAMGLIDGNGDAGTGRGGSEASQDVAMVRFRPGRCSGLSQR